VTPYERAQQAVRELKVAVLELLRSHGGREGLTNAEIGRALGIYMGHVGHEGHISRTILALLQEDGAIAQDSGSKRWRFPQGSST